MFNASLDFVVINYPTSKAKNEENSIAQQVPLRLQNVLRNQRNDVQIRLLSTCTVKKDYLKGE